MKRKEFKPGVVFREKPSFPADKVDHSIYELVEIPASHSVFTGLRQMEIREVFGNKRFQCVVPQKDRFMAVTFVMGNAVVVKVLYDSLERMPRLEKSMKEILQNLKSC